MQTPDSDIKGLKFDYVFSNPNRSVEGQFGWTTTQAEIKGDDGEVLFTQPITAPTAWSDLARKVVASKYFHGTQGTPERETHVGGLVDRVVDPIALWGLNHGYFATGFDAVVFAKELRWLLLSQYGSFNSPVWFNVGVTANRSTGFVWDDDLNGGQGGVRAVGEGEHRPQASACFINSVEDSMESIMALATTEAMLFRSGSGTGTDLSTIRSRRERLSGGGVPSGPMSFLKVYDATAGVVKSGGRSRRAAKMNTLACTHPDILDFITAKAREDHKAQALRRFAGCSGGMNGEAAGSVAFQNANLSVRASNEFMSKVTGIDPVDNYATVAVTTGEAVETLSAGEVMDAIAEGTLACGDPGMQFSDTINAWHTCPNSGPINTSNPCSEYLFLDDSACNLASLNLMKFRRPDGSFDTDRFEQAVRIFFVAQEILVDLASYPTEKIAQNSHDFRPLGLGYANLGALLMTGGLAYDSDQGRALAGAITSLMQATCAQTTAELARIKGSFAGFEANREPFLSIIAAHSNKADQDFYYSGDNSEIERITGQATDLWYDAISDIARYGARNAQFTVIAPTGTIAFMMDCATTGIEPDIALVKYKSLAGGGTLKLVNPLVRDALKNLAYPDDQIDELVRHVEEHGTIEGHDALDPEHLSIFDCAFAAQPGGRSISPEGHLKMMAAVQPFLSGAISKTVNLPRGSTAATVRQTYIDAWMMGLKAVAIYVDGSKESQAVATSADGFVNNSSVDPFYETLRADPTVQAIAAQAAVEARQTLPQEALTRVLDQAPMPTPCRHRLPETRASLTHKFAVGGHEGYLTVGLNAQGQPAEFFVTISKSGSALQGMVNFGVTMASVALQHGAALETILDKMRGTRFAPSGFTASPEVRTCTSLLDYFAQWIEKTFVHQNAAFQNQDELYEAWAKYDRSQRTPQEPQDEPGGDEGDNPPPGPSDSPQGRLEALWENRHVVPALVPVGEACEACGSFAMIPNGRCLICTNCGVSPGNCGG